MTETTAAPGATSSAIMASKEVIEKITRDFNELRQKLRNLISSLSSKEDELDKKIKARSMDLYGTKDYTLRKSYGKTILVFITILLVAGAEFGFNKTALQSLRFNDTITLISSVIIGLILAGFAEASGFAMKRASVTGSVMMGFWSLVAMGAAAGLMYVVAILRYDYFVSTHRHTWSIPTQMLMMFSIFMVGVFVGYVTTTSTKNKRAEDLFGDLKDDLRKVKSDLKKTKNQLDNLNKEQEKAVQRAHVEARRLARRQAREEKRAIADLERAEAKKAKTAKVAPAPVAVEPEEENPKQKAFEDAANAFLVKITEATDKMKFVGGTGDDIRTLLKDDVEALDIQLVALEDVAMYWSGSGPKMTEVTNIFSAFKISLDEL